MTRRWDPYTEDLQFEAKSSGAKGSGDGAICENPTVGSPSGQLC